MHGLGNRTLILKYFAAFKLFKRSNERQSLMMKFNLPAHFQPSASKIEFALLEFLSVYLLSIPATAALPCQLFWCFLDSANDNRAPPFASVYVQLSICTSMTLHQGAGRT